MFGLEKGEIPASLKVELQRTGSAMLEAPLTHLYGRGSNSDNIWYFGKKDVIQFYVGIIMPKHSVYKPLVDKVIHSLVAGGIVQHLELKYTRSRKEEVEGLGRRSLTMEHTLPGLFILAIGLVLASGLAITEAMTRKGLKQTDRWM